MPIRSIAVLGAVFSAATGTWLLVMPSTAEAMPTVGLQAGCTPWPYRPCPPPPPPRCPSCDRDHDRDHDHARDHDRDRSYREHAEYGGYEEYEEQEEGYTEQRRSRERRNTRIEAPEIAPRVTPRVAAPARAKRDTVLPKTGAEVALLGATSIALITGGVLVLSRRRRTRDYY